MEELSRADETFDKFKEKTVRVVYFPTETAAKLRCEASDPLNANDEAIIEKFIKDTNLAKIKPDFRVISFGKIILITVPEDFEITVPFVKSIIYGGLYAGVAKQE